MRYILYVIRYALYVMPYTLRLRYALMRALRYVLK